MAKRLQLRGGTTAQNNAFTGAAREVTVDTETWSLRLHDGTTAGGKILSDWSNVTGNLLPRLNNTYDLGSPSKQWRDLFVSDGSIYLGDIKLSNQNGLLVVQQVTNPGLSTEAPVAGAPGKVTTDRLINGNNSLVLGNNGVVELNGDLFRNIEPSITGTFSSVASSACTIAQQGQMAFLTNSMLQGRCSGTNWEWWWKGFKVNLPWADGTWINQQGSSINNINGTSVLTMAPSMPGGTNAVLQVKNLPNTAYSVVIGFIMTGTTGVLGAGCAVVLRESGTGKIIRFGPNSFEITSDGSSSPFLTLDQWNSATSWNSTIRNQSGDLMSLPNSHLFLKITNNGTTRSFFVSQDGYNWGIYQTQAAGSFINEDQYGFGCFQGAAAGGGLSMVVFHLDVS